MARRYVPDRGDIVWLQFAPPASHEQTGHRPALVVSPRTYNRKAHLALCCPVTSRIKGYPFEVVLPAGLKTTGAVLSDQIKSLDWNARKAKRIGKVPNEVVAEVLGKIATLLRCPDEL